MDTLVFQSSDADVIFSDCGGDVCVVTFTPWVRQPPGQPFGKAFLEASGFSAVHFIGKRNDWWEQPGLNEAVARVRELIAPFGRRVSYGSSMGAFGAILFADALGCGEVIAISPQASIDRNTVPWETGWPEEAAALRHRIGGCGARLSPRQQVHIAFDPWLSRDLKHATLIAADGARNGASVRLLKFGFAGHPVTTALADAGLLSGMVRRLIRGEPIGDVRAEYRRARLASAAANLSVLHNPEMNARHKATTLRFAKAAIARFPGDPRFPLQYARQLLANKYNSEAAIAGREAAQMLTGKLAGEAWLVVARGLKHAGQNSDALEAYERAVELNPNERLFREKEELAAKVASSQPTPPGSPARHSPAADSPLTDLREPEPAAAPAKLQWLSALRGWFRREAEAGH